MWGAFRNILNQVVDLSMFSFTTPEPGPTIQDVFRVKGLLQRAFAGEVIPLEIVDIIIDFAEYWPHTSNSRRIDNCDAYGATDQGNRWTEDRFACRSLPLGYMPDSVDDTNSFLQPTSNFSKQKPHAAPHSEPDPDLEAKRTTLLKQWVSQSTPRSGNPCRKIVFTIKSHDQGWGGDRADRGTYHGSFTWFDAGLERLEIVSGEVVDVPVFGNVNIQEENTAEVSSTPYTLRTIEPAVVPSEINPAVCKFDHPLYTVPSNCIQRNKTATSEVQEHVVTWKYNDAVDPDSEEGKALEEIGRGRASASGEFVRNLKLGDIVTVWSRARFQGWKNVVEGVKVDIYWAI